MSDGHRELKVSPKFYVQLPHLAFMDKSFYWLSYQQVELHNIKDIETQLHFGYIYQDRMGTNNSQTGTMCPK
jgi:hypothetical protein